MDITQRIDKIAEFISQQKFLKGATIIVEAASPEDIVLICKSLYKDQESKLRTALDDHYLSHIEIKVIKYLKPRKNNEHKQ